MARQLVDDNFLEGLYDVCDPPFCFSCGDHRGCCRCKEGPLSKSAWQAIKHPSKAQCKKSESVTQESRGLPENYYDDDYYDDTRPF